MMKRINSFIAILAAAAGFVSCAKKELVNPKDNDADFVSVIHANTDEATSKTSLGDGYTILWSEGDQIVLSDQTNNFTFKLKEGAGTTSGTFERVGSVQSGVYNAYYPHTYDGVSWTAVQTYVKNGDARENMITDAPMIAALVTVSDEGEISDVTFENVGGILQLSVTGKETIKSISFEAQSVGGVTLDCGEGVALDQTHPTKFNIALKGGVYESAVITFVSTYGAKIEKKASSFTVKTGKIYPTNFGTLDFPAMLLVSSEKARVTEPQKATLYGKVIYTGKESEYSSVEYGFAYTNNAEYTTAEAIYANGMKKTMETPFTSSPAEYSATLSGLMGSSSYNWIAYAKKGDKVKLGEVKDFKTSELQMSVSINSVSYNAFSASFDDRIKFNAEPSVKTGYTAYLLIDKGDKTKEELEMVIPVNLNVSDIQGEGASSHFVITGEISGLEPSTKYSYMVAALMPDGYTYAESDVASFSTTALNLNILVDVLTSNPSTYMDVKASLDKSALGTSETKYLQKQEHRPVFKLALTGKSGYHDAKSLMELSGVKQSGEMTANDDLQATYKFEGLDYGLMNHLAISVMIDGRTYYSDIKNIQLALPNGCVDLGSGSSVYWRDRNLGASEVASQSAGASARGDYYMWGETDWRHTGDWSSDYFKDDHYFGWGTGHYKWQLGSGVNVKKYIMKNHDGDGAIDNKSTLDMEDDAARVNLGYPWRMPRVSECEELEKKEAFTCVKYPHDDDDKVYYEVKSKNNGQTVKFQTTGKFHYKDLEERNTVGIWTADLYTTEDWNSQAWCLRLYSGDWETELGLWRRDRVDGYCIRPVCSKITSANY